MYRTTSVSSDKHTTCHTHPRMCCMCLWLARSQALGLASCVRMPGVQTRARHTYLWEAKARAFCFAVFLGSGTVSSSEVFTFNIDPLGTTLAIAAGGALIGGFSALGAPWSFSVFSGFDCVRARQRLACSVSVCLCCVSCRAALLAHLFGSRAGLILSILGRLGRGPCVASRVCARI